MLTPALYDSLFRGQFKDRWMQVGVLSTQIISETGDWTNCTYLAFSLYKKINIIHIYGSNLLGWNRHWIVWVLPWFIPLWLPLHRLIILQTRHPSIKPRVEKWHFCLGRRAHHLITHYFTIQTQDFLYLLLGYLRLYSWS